VLFDKHHNTYKTRDKMNDDNYTVAAQTLADCALTHVERLSDAFLH
jgi:hypothetical protein